MSDGNGTGSMSTGSISTGSLSLTVHLLKVTLMDVSPPVWRLIRVPSAIPLSALHGVLQVALGWEDRHMHQWRVGDTLYGPPDEEDWGDELADEASAVLGQVAGEDDVLRYDYDLSDGWEHLVEVVAVQPYDGTVAPVEVLDGARAVPPEDCGGPSGYEHLVDAMYDPDDPEHEELQDAIGDAFDPEWFDRGAVNRRLEMLWRPGL